MSPGRRAPLGAAGGTHAPVGMLVYSNVQPTARLNIQVRTADFLKSVRSADAVQRVI